VKGESENYFYDAVFLFAQKKARESGDYRKDKVLTARNAGGYKSNIFNNTSPLCVCLAEILGVLKGWIFIMGTWSKNVITLISRVAKLIVCVAQECNIIWTYRTLVFVHYDIKERPPRCI